MLNNIKFGGGGTDFGPPLDMAFKLCKEFYKTNDKLVLYFLTDGGADIPHLFIKAFNEDNHIKRKIEFHAVGFGRDADIKILRKIAKKMPNGKVS